MCARVSQFQYYVETISPQDLPCDFPRKHHYECVDNSEWHHHSVNLITYSTVILRTAVPVVDDSSAGVLLALSQNEIAACRFAVGGNLLCSLPIVFIPVRTVEIIVCY